MEPQLAEIVEGRAYKAIAAVLTPEHLELLMALCERCYVKGKAVALTELRAIVEGTHA